MVSQIVQLHRAIDTMVQPLEEMNRGALQCTKGCFGCCVDGITVFDAEAQVIRSNHGKLLENGIPHGRGRCAFLNPEGACRIYPQRPYVCRTQGLPLRWFERDKETEEAAEFRDICELNEGVGPLEELPPEQCWTVGAVEERLAAIDQNVSQSETSRGTTRIALRDLFQRKPVSVK